MLPVVWVAVVLTVGASRWALGVVTHVAMPLRAAAVEARTLGPVLIKATIGR